MNGKTLFSTFALACLWIASLQAQDVYYDVTSVYLKNAGFDTHFDYTVDDEGDVESEMLDIYGWTHTDPSVTNLIAGIYQFGTKKTFTGWPVPAVGSDGEAGGGGLVFSPGFQSSQSYYQTIMLPPGNYRMVAMYYNASTQPNAYNVTAWIPSAGRRTQSRLRTFPQGVWTGDTLTFTVAEQISGKVQVGYTVNQSSTTGTMAQMILDFVKIERDTPIDAVDSLAKKALLKQYIDEALNVYGDGSGIGADALKDVIDAAQAVYDADEVSFDDIDEQVALLVKALDEYNWDNSGKSVVTDPRFARGSSMAFGRMSTKGFTTSEIKEQGFCYATHENPTVEDGVTTSFLSNNGNIYYMEDLTPCTQYYMRAFVKTKEGKVKYGDDIKFYTIARGNITYWYNNGGDDAANNRVNKAATEACEIFNKLTATRKAFSIGYSAGTPTADCYYADNPWMNMGANSSYQRTGTIMHEMEHGLGVIPYSTQWSKTTLRSGTQSYNGGTVGSGQWLGDRVSAFLDFWDNTTGSRLNGDYQHMWPYGINGASEDNGSKVLYYANALICQALGEDGLEHNYSSYADPYYSFNHDDEVKYYLKSENEGRGLYTSYLMEGKNGQLKIAEMSSDDAAANDSAAWYLSFEPSTQYYTIRNAATGKYITYNSSRFVAAERTSPVANDWLHLMRGRVDVTTEKYRGYWMIHPITDWNPNCMVANASGSVGQATFNLANSATTQRWLILTEEEMRKINAYTDGIKAIESGDDAREAIESQGMFDLQGRRVNNANGQRKGIYIVNGKKVIN
ncbi:MAG: hypothetical protein IJK87_06675 [Prevotella sp.]|nr:hypothetical protein [Prevotella sp.]